MNATDTPRTDRWNTPERAALRETVRAFAAREILPHVDRWEEEGRLPRDLHRAAGRLGLLGLGQPESVGGAGEMLDQLVVSEEAVLAGVPTGVLASLFTHTIALPALVADGREHLVRDYVRPALEGESICSLGITEPGAGSDVAGLRTRAVRDGDEWVLDGSKTFITSGCRADFVTVAARTSDTGHEGISLFVVERGTPGFTVTRALDKMGWHSSDTAELSLVDVRVPADRLVGEVDRGFSRSWISSRASGSACPYRPARSRGAASTSPWSGCANGRPSAALWHDGRSCGTGWWRCTVVPRSPPPTFGGSPNGSRTGNRSSRRWRWPRTPRPRRWTAWSTTPSNCTEGWVSCAGPRWNATTGTPGCSPLEAAPTRS
ncbi:putative acyl CoA dehydrogenase [Nocardiopsis alba ATCC BAA-2165]|uniref:Putative acyl CoA dehydrogenase n=1 Tax=Nocardiopsis alba (strain ATCC BAA-2165 / BE74) TaxID=1205910 RepID=J7L7Z4_NOCAA|nr:putative acyl CoA dehydrogenase [Nocardiopsis alba ATCC BAA-2165]